MNANDYKSKGYGINKSEHVEETPKKVLSENGKDLRQDIYHAWIKYETGKWPGSYFSFTVQRENNSIISVVIEVTFRALFVIRLK